MNKNWFIIIIAIFLTILIWSGLEVYSCIGGFSKDIFGIGLPICKYKNNQDLVNMTITPAPDSLNLNSISDIKTQEDLVLIKDKSEL